MLKHVICFLACVSPCMGATLSGIVRLDEGRPLSGAKVVVLHELAMVMVRQGFTDRKGEYRFNLEPGPYRIFIFKEDSLPHTTRTMLLHANEELTLEHRLVKTLSVSERKPATNLKNILRRSNRDPFRDTFYAPLVHFAWQPALTGELAGTVNTIHHRDLNGAIVQTASYDVSAQLTDSLKVQSRVSNQQQELQDTTRIEAGVAMNTGRLALGVEAKRILPATDLDVKGSDVVRLSGSYGDGWRTTTAVSMTRSPLPQNEQMALELTQEFSYRLGSLPVVHEVNMTEWYMDKTSAARESTIATRLDPSVFGWFGAAADLHQVRLEDGSYTNAKFWLSGRFGENEGLGAESRIGLYNEDSKDALIQDHAVHYRRGTLLLSARYLDDSSFQVLASQDVFGSYLPRPTTPFATEAFFRQSEQRSEVNIASQITNGWHSTFSWRRTDQAASRLYSMRSDGYKDRAELSYEEFSYALRSDRLGSSFEVSHGQHADESRDFGSLGLAITQSLNPFRQSGVELLVQLQMRNQPDLPAWWLLDEMPWSPAEESTWYEGYLSLQF